MQLLVFDRKKWNKEYRQTEAGKEAYRVARRNYYQRRKNDPDFIAKHSERMKKYQLANSAILNEKKRQYYLDKKRQEPNFMQKVREQSRRSYAANKDKPEYRAKIKEKNKQRYAILRLNPEYLAKVNEKVKRRWKEMSFEKKQLHALPSMKSRNKIRESIFHLLNQHWCQNCGEHDKRCLQFDHLNGGGTQELKLGMKNRNKFYSSYLDNAEETKRKIQVLCANCNWKKRFLKNENGNYMKSLEVV